MKTRFYFQDEIIAEESDLTEKGKERGSIKKIPFLTLTRGREG